MTSRIFEIDLVFQRAEIKRINNLISDQDFYALKYIKVPAIKHSVLFETHSTVPTSPKEGDGKNSILDAAKEDTSGVKWATNDESSPSGASLASFDFNSKSVNSDPRLDPAKWLESRTVSINQVICFSWRGLFVFYSQQLNSGLKERFKIISLVH